MQIESYAKILIHEMFFLILRNIKLWYQLMAEKQTYHENPYPFITLMDTLIPSHSFPHSGFWHTYCFSLPTLPKVKSFPSWWRGWWVIHEVYIIVFSMLDNINWIRLDMTELNWINKYHVLCLVCIEQDTIIYCNDNNIIILSNV